MAELRFNAKFNTPSTNSSEPIKYMVLMEVKEKTENSVVFVPISLRAHNVTSIPWHNALTIPNFAFLTILSNLKCLPLFLCLSKFYLSIKSSSNSNSPLPGGLPHKLFPSCSLSFLCIFNPIYCRSDSTIHPSIPETCCLLYTSDAADECVNV